MAEMVTRKFVNPSTGAPITGASFRLASKSDHSSDPIAMNEIPTQVEADQGQYISDSAVPHGVYKVQILQGGIYIDFLDTSGNVAEITMEPGRHNAPGASGTLIDLVIDNVVQACAFVSEDRSAPRGIDLQTALYWASSHGYTKVIVGAFRGILNWPGVRPVYVPAGMDVDLLGATITNQTPADTVLSLSGTGVVRNGKLQATPSGGTGFKMVNASDSGSLALFWNVEFAGSPGNVPTVSISDGTESLAVFIGCKNVILRDPNLDSGGNKQRVRKQFSVGAGTNPTNQAGDTLVELMRANVTGQELGDFMRPLMELSSIGPLDNSTPQKRETPFASMTEAANALKDAWYMKPMFFWMGKHGASNPKGDVDLVATPIPLPGGNIDNWQGLGVLERKAVVYGNSVERKLKINIAGSCRFKIGDTGGDSTRADFSLTIDMTDLDAALLAAFPTAPSVFFKTADLFRKYEGTEEIGIGGSDILLYIPPTVNWFSKTVAVAWDDTSLPSGWSSPAIFPSYYSGIGVGADAPYLNQSTVHCDSDGHMTIDVQIYLNGNFKNRPMKAIFQTEIDMPYPQFKHRVLTSDDVAYKNAGFGTIAGIAYNKAVF